MGVQERNRSVRRPTAGRPARRAACCADAPPRLARSRRLARAARRDPRHRGRWRHRRAITGTPLDPIRQQVAVYATSEGLAAILTGLQTAVLPLKVKDNKIIAVLPRICRPPGTLASDCASGDILLKELDTEVRKSNTNCRRG